MSRNVSRSNPAFANKPTSYEHAHITPKHDVLIGPLQHFYSNQATVEMVTSDNDGSQSQAVEEQPVPETQEPATTSSLPESGIFDLLSVEHVCSNYPGTGVI